MRLVQVLTVLCSMVLFADACGDCADCAEPPHETGGCDCPCGTTLYRVSTGIYTTQAVQNLSEDCDLGLTPERVSTNRKVEWDHATGAIVISSADGSLIMGIGPVRCNKGTLTYTATLGSGACIFESARSSQLEVTADTTLTLQYSETRTNFRSAAGMTCTAPLSGTCKISYTLTLKQ